MKKSLKRLEAMRKDIMSKGETQKKFDKFNPPTNPK